MVKESCPSTAEAKGDLQETSLPSQASSCNTTSHCILRCEDSSTKKKTPKSVTTSFAGMPGTAAP
eukprot:10384936-Lingulodinium_polyedra.AAC.1